MRVSSYLAQLPELENLDFLEMRLVFDIGGLDLLLEVVDLMDSAKDGGGEIRLRHGYHLNKKPWGPGL